jgi:GNAT superfamily N-acetyltransferase
MMTSTVLPYGQSDADFRHLTPADARRMEAAEEYGALRYAQAVKPEHPDWGTAWEEFGGGHLVFVQRVSPVGRAHGLGFKGGATPQDVAHIENFYFSRETDAQVDVCPYADPSLFAALNERGFQVAEFNQTLARWILADEKLEAPKLKDVAVRSIRPAEAAEWSAVSARVFFGDQWQQWQELFKPWADAPDAMNLAAFADGQMVGMAGGMIVREYNMAGFWGASVLAEFRGRGIQRAFLQERLRLAQQAGCDLAVTLTLPGTTSQRNAERAGFRTAYTKVVCIKRHPEGKGTYVQVGYSE